MTKRKEFREIGLFTFLCFLYSWPFFFCVDAWLGPMFLQQGNLAAAGWSILGGHMLGMLGPALAALTMWRFYHKESPPVWKWSLPKYYLWVVLAMLAFWTLPGLIGLFFGDSFTSPIQTQTWLSIALMLGLGWLTGMGEETGWCAYMLTRFSPSGKARAIIISSVIRGLWHWPVVLGPVIAQVVAGEHTLLEMAGAAVVIAIQLVLSNLFFGAVFGFVWYRTESLPQAGWLHFWHDLARDVTIMLLVGYGGSLWVRSLNAFIWLPIGYLLLYTILSEEGLNWKRFFKQEKPSQAG